MKAVAKLLGDEAPRTAAAVWDALPLGDQVFHGKFARNEIYTLVAAFADTEPGPENTTITPIPGDLCYFTFDGVLNNPAYGYEPGAAPGKHQLLIDLAVFYGRNNLLVNGDVGWVPGNVFGTIVEDCRSSPRRAMTCGWAVRAVKYCRTRENERSRR